jgi:hypothetical protein
MKKRPLIIGGLIAMGYFLFTKYTNFVDRLSFRINKAKVKFPYPYNSLQIVLDCNIYNPTNTKVELRNLYGTLSYQGKKVADIFAPSKYIQSGDNQVDATINISVGDLENIMNVDFDFSSVSSVYNQIIRTPFTTDITYTTNLGTFNSKDDWKLQELL